MGPDRLPLTEAAAEKTQRSFAVWPLLRREGFCPQEYWLAVVFHLLLGPETEPAKDSTQSLFRGVILPELFV